jgi:hypothetical protein
LQITGPDDSLDCSGEKDWIGSVGKNQDRAKGNTKVTTYTRERS